MVTMTCITRTEVDMCFLCKICPSAQVATEVSCRKEAVFG